MTRFEETRLPGVGLRHDFLTRAGRRVGVITHHGGRRELLVYDDDDPDRCTETLQLDQDDSLALVELLGGSQIITALGSVQQRVEGLAIDWLHIGQDWSAAGQSIASTQLRHRTGVSIVAILRGSETKPSPVPSEVLRPDDTVVVVGTPEGIDAASAVLRDG